MKKWMSLVFVGILLFSFALCSCDQAITNKISSSKNTSADTLYNEFLSKKTNAIDKNGNTIMFEAYLNSESKNIYFQYAIYDMNGDDVPELIIKTVDGLDIFWIKNDKVTLWYQGTSYTKPLNNMALLSERKGGAPEHVDYTYFILGYQGEEVFKIEFSKYSDSSLQGVQYEKKYFINNIEVNEQIYNSLTGPLLTVNDDKLTWKELQ